jgi:hypothetical protein
MKTPPSEDFKNIILKTMKGRTDDRSAALSVAATADTGIMVTIMMMQPKHPTPSADELFRNTRAKFGNFNNRIDHVAKLGIIGPKTQNVTCTSSGPCGMSSLTPW